MKQVVRLTEEDLHYIVSEAVDDYYFNVINEAAENPEQLNEMAPLVATALRTLAKPVSKWVGRKVGKGFTKAAAKAGATKLGKTFGKNVSKRDLAKLRRLAINGAEVYTAGKILDKTSGDDDKGKNDGSNKSNNNKRRGTRRSGLRF